MRRINCYNHDFSVNRKGLFLMHIFLCEDSIDGIFTGIYDAWASRYGHKNIKLCINDTITYELFSEYITVTPDSEKSEKVGRTIIARLGMEVYQDILQAVLAHDDKKKNEQPDKADCIYRTLLYGFSLADGHRILQALGNPYIARVFELSRSTGNEAHHLLGFLRFQELENGVLFSAIHPKNQVISVLAEHFADRLPQEHFMIYDATHQIAAIHKAGSGYFLTDASNLNPDVITRLSPAEKEYQKLWCGFFDSISIEARKNPKLQSQNIPKRFWKDTVELASDK